MLLKNLYQKKSVKSVLKTLEGIDITGPCVRCTRV